MKTKMKKKNLFVQMNTDECIDVTGKYFQILHIKD